MGTHPLLDPDSTVRLVYEALSAGSVMTQKQLCGRVERTQGAVCKAVQLLMSEGYAKRVGKTTNQYGRSVGKPQLQFAGTGKLIGAEEIQPATPTVLELAAIMNALIRRGRKRK